MVKIGPAFFDSIAKDNNRRRHGGSFGSISEVMSFLPVLLFALVFLAIILRLFYVQVIRGSYYKGLADSNRTRTVVIPAPRGVIFDREGRPLVSNTAIYKVKKGDKYETIKDENALSLITQGKKVEAEVRREYVYKGAFAHVLGYVGQISEEQMAMPEYDFYYIHDRLGKMGIEKQYEAILHGQNGRRLFEVDAGGNFVRELGRSEPVSGRNIVTTLDLDVQLSAEKAFEGSVRGAVVVSDPNTGALLALYSSPSFDPNLFTSEEYKAEGEYKTVGDVINDSDKQPLLNRAVSGVYPPGSTFKLVSGVAALEKGAITSDTHFEDTGILKVGDFSFGNWYYLQYGGKDGDVDIVKAIKRSNDIFFYKASEKTGVDYISRFSTKFGLGSKLGLDLPGEVAGTVPTMAWKKKVIGEQWYLGDTYNYGIGQGYLLTTPLQVNTFTTAFANGGILYKPHLVESGKPVVRLENFMDKKNIDLIKQGMLESCEQGGVAWPFFDFKVKNDKLKIDESDYFKDASAGAQMVRVKVGCKTGTAETGGKEDKPHSWITVFAPYHKPEVVVTVLVENGGEGSSVAGPIAKKILSDYFTKKH